MPSTYGVLSTTVATVVPVERVYVHVRSLRFASVGRTLWIWRAQFPLRREDLNSNVQYVRSSRRSHLFFPTLNVLSNQHASDIDCFHATLH
jgi:hypothetical protein